MLRRMTTSLVARLNSQPPKMSICYPIDVEVCPYLLLGGDLLNLLLSQENLFVFNILK